METSDTISKRASLKGYISSREIEQDKIEKILESGRLAPSARNNQPWKFIVIRDKEVLDNLAENAFGGPNYVVKDAPVIIIACANPKDDIVRDGREYYLFDVALAMENMILTATDLGLVTHLMTGVDGEEIKKILGIPKDVQFVVATPLAYPKGDSYDAAAKDRLSERERKPMQEIAYSDKWANPF